MSIEEAFALALQHHQAGQLPQAEALYRQILAVQPAHADALHLLGVLAHQCGQHDLALSWINQSVVFNPQSAAAWSNLGIVLQYLGRLGEAIAAYQRAVALNPHYPEAYSNLGNALKSENRLEEAVAACRRAIELKPDYPEAWNNLGNAYRGEEDVDEAIAAYSQALALQPNSAEIWSNLGNALKDQGLFEEARQAFAKALVFKPQFAEAYDNLLYVGHFNPAGDAQSLAAERRQWSEQLLQGLGPAHASHGNSPDPERRLRVGYVSADFRGHVVGLNLRPLFAQHDRAAFEIFCYSGVLSADGVTAEFQHRADHWVSTVGLSDEALAARIRQDQIDILVDLSQHSAGNRLTVFARRPAPVQVSFAGYPDTAGLATIGHRLTDRLLESGRDAASSHPGEQLHFLDSFWCYDPQGLELAVNALPAANGQPLTFGCLNNFSKVNTPTLRLWARVLAALPASRLVILSPAGRHRQSALQILAEGGVAAERVEFVGPRPRPAYMELYRRVDVILDTFPYGGHTTSLDALWMGVPVISRVGSEPVSRAAWSQLTNLGLPELVALTDEDYVRIATHLASDLPRLAELRATLRGRLERSVLMDAPRFARQIQAAYRQMWRQWCTDTATPAARSVEETFALALQHRQAGQFPQAEALLRQILAIRPAHADALHLLGVLAHQSGQHDLALTWINNAIAVDPENASAHCNLGILLYDEGRLDEAIAAFRQAVALEPNYTDALSNLGDSLSAQGHLDEALSAYRSALRIQPASAVTINRVGNVFWQKGELDTAEAQYRQALAVDPQYAEAWNNLANTLRDRGRLDAAIEAYRKALTLEPQRAEIYSNLGNALKDQGLYEDARRAYARALAIKPQFTNAHHNFLYTGLFDPASNGQSSAAERRHWSEQLLQSLDSAHAPHGNAPDPERRLRVGYVSPDFRAHVVGHNLRPLFAHHDHSAFEVFCYSGVIGADGVTAEFQQRADHWLSTVGMSDDALAERMRQDGIDILVDLSQHMAGNRLAVLARRPAPVQVSFAGYPDTTGLEAIGHRLTDGLLESGREAAWLHAGEQLHFLDSFWCYDPQGLELEVNALPSLHGEPLTFGCLNNFCKVNTSVLRLWARVLKALPGSRLVILSPAGGHRQRALEILGADGLAAERVEFVDPRPRPAYLELYQRLDLVLDTFPYNGHTTSLDALWMGVPVISRAGTEPVSRAGWSQMSNLGLPELVAFSDDEYVRIATGLANDLPRLAELRATLRARMECSVLMDGARFARQIEAAYRQMWRQWCARDC